MRRHTVVMRFSTRVQAGEVPAVADRDAAVHEWYRK